MKFNDISDISMITTEIIMIALQAARRSPEQPWRLPPLISNDGELAGGHCGGHDDHRGHRAIVVIMVTTRVVVVIMIIMVATGVIVVIMKTVVIVMIPLVTLLNIVIREATLIGGLG